MNYTKILRVFMFMSVSVITTLHANDQDGTPSSLVTIGAAPHLFGQAQQMATPATVTLPGSGFINVAPKPDYKLIAATIYAENNLPSPYDPWYKKTTRACDYLVTDPQTCCSVFWGCNDLEGVEQLRSQYCDKDASQLTLGKLPVSHRPDAAAIMQAVDEHTTDVLASYFDHQEQSSVLELTSDKIDIHCIKSSVWCCITVGVVDPTKCSALLLPWCIASGSTCCLSRAAVVVDYM